MEFTFTQTDAQVLYAFLASVLVPMLVSLFARPSTPSGAKATLAVVASVAGALLSQYAAGAFDGGSIVVAAVGIFTASQAHFATWFQSLGWNDWFLSVFAPPKV